MQRDDGIYVVADDVATHLPPDDEPHVLTDEEKHVAGDVLPFTADQILFIAAEIAKQRAFPVEVVNTVLDFAGVYITFQCQTTERRGGHNNMNDDYLVLDLPSKEQLSLPEGMDLARCVLLVADCCSKDQGWASQDRHLNGTYKGSYTWSEVVVKKPRTEDDDAATLRKEVARERLYMNVRARSIFRHHRKYFRKPTGLIQHIVPGDTVHLVLRSQFPGWANSANYGKLSVCFTVEFDEEFVFDANMDMPPTSHRESNAGPISCSVQ